MVTERTWSDEMRRGGNDDIVWAELKAPVIVLLVFSFLVAVGFLVGISCVQP